MSHTLSCSTALERAASERTQRAVVEPVVMYKDMVGVLEGLASPAPEELLEKKTGVARALLRAPALALAAPRILHPILSTLTMNPKLFAPHTPACACSRVFPRLNLEH